MVVEVRVFGGDDRFHEGGCHVALADDDAFLDRVLREGHAVSIVDASDDRRLVVLERFHQGHLNRVRQHESGWHADGEGHEENQQAGAPAGGRRRRGAGGGFGHGVRIQ